MVSISSQVEPSKPQNMIQILLVVWLLSSIWKDLIMNAKKKKKEIIYCFQCGHEVLFFGNVPTLICQVLNHAISSRQGTELTSLNGSVNDKLLL